MDIYVQRLPIEIILSSVNGLTIDDIDGNKLYNLQTEVSARNNEFLVIYLKKAFIPFSFYLISADRNNNLLNITEKKTNNDTNSYNITIENGNYNITDLINTIKSKMESASTYNFKYLITFNQITGKISFLLSSGTDFLSTTLNFKSQNKNVHNIIGFSNIADITFTNSTQAISDKIIDIADGLDGLHIKSNLVGDNIITTQNDSGSGELLIVPIETDAYSIIYYSELGTPFKHKLAQKSIRQIEIKITDSFDNIINFNNLPYTFILHCEFLFNPNASSSISISNTNNNDIIKKNKKITKKILKNLNNDII